MKYFSKHFSETVLALGIMLMAVPAARADTICSNQGLSGSTVNGNLIVPPGAACTLNGVTVTGSVQVQLNARLTVGDAGASTGSNTIGGNLLVGTGATLFAEVFTPMTVVGHVIAGQCNALAMLPGFEVAGFVNIGGNVEIQKCTGQVATENAQIAGNFNCSNIANICALALSSINGNAQVNNNSEANVVGNTISGNLQCQGNANITDFGQPNTVGGAKLGRCAGF